MDIFCLIRYKHVAFNTCCKFIWFQLFNAFLLDIQDDAPPLVMFIFAFWFLYSFAFNMVFHICNSVSSLPFILTGKQNMKANLNQTSLIHGFYHILIVFDTYK